MRLWGCHILIDNGMESCHMQHHAKAFSCLFFPVSVAFLLQKSLGQKVQLWIICASSWADKNIKERYERMVFRVKGRTKNVLVFGKIVIKHPAKNNEKSHRQEIQLTMANKASGTHVWIWIRWNLFFFFFFVCQNKQLQEKRLPW